MTRDTVSKIVAILFAIACLTTSAVSNSLLGAGMWFFIIIGVGIFVAASQYVPLLRGLGSVAAVVLGTISVIAVVFTLIAATTGGSFRLEGPEALLVFSFFMIAVLGFLLARINRKISPPPNYQPSPPE